MYQVIGVERISYKSKKTDKIVEGYRVYFTFDLNTDGGLGADNCFVGTTDYERHPVMPGDVAMPVYNKYGRCTGFMDGAV